MNTPAFHDSKHALPVSEHGKSTGSHGNHQRAARLARLATLAIAWAVVLGTVISILGVMYYLTAHSPLDGVPRAHVYPYPYPRPTPTASLPTPHWTEVPPPIAGFPFH
ncbi:hypothetical protein C8A01DRAFT_39831 [Parachaetomium inaequale]|uniref:Uncharacterized protein n=1 Tax=Parachaetomium inaequale TaxID=2588326 RepID=A0AAN6SNF7_9PEZI|nr:hypothetical protein C8A01DRAFT_39831 [Parachaetomium inaequale]